MDLLRKPVLIVVCLALIGAASIVVPFFVASVVVIIADLLYERSFFELTHEQDVLFVAIMIPSVMIFGFVTYKLADNLPSTKNRRP